MPRSWPAVRAERRSRVRRPIGCAPASRTCQHMKPFAGNTTHSDQLVERPRLTNRLLGRFDHRVTTVVAPAGSGKTAALSLARRNNALDPVGLDVWVDARPSDNDLMHFLAA